MKYNSKIHKRRSIRLKGHDYSQNGMYFITVCTFNRECIFGEIVNDEMQLNEFGAIIYEEWQKSFNIRAEMSMDEFIIMPNHIHGIVMIDGVERCLIHKGDRPVAPTCLTKQSIGSFVAGFKSSATKRINQMRLMPKAQVWQRNYYEHIIRSEITLQKLREYVIQNPKRWKDDLLYI